MDRGNVPSLLMSVHFALCNFEIQLAARDVANFVGFLIHLPTTSIAQISKFREELCESEAKQSRL